MDSAVVRATLELAGSVRVDSRSGELEVRLIRSGDWRGSPLLSHYTLMLLLSRLWRWLRRDRRWFVVVVRAGAGNREGEIRAEAQSRAEALDKAVEVAEQLMSPT